MRVLFVYPDMSSTVTGYTGAVSFAVAQLSAVLRAAGHQTSLYHVIQEPDRDEFQARVRAARPDLVAFSSSSNYARRLKRWTTWAHEACGAPVAVGGMHATFAPEEVSGHADVHFTCVGEGEEALLELCDRLEHGGDPTTVDSFWARRDGDVVRNRVRPLRENLDELPDLDLSVFDVPNLYNSRAGTFHHLMSRGCTFHCTYCAAHALKHVAPVTGSYWRFLSPERAATQLAALVSRYLPDAKLVSSVDAIFFPNRTWLREFVPLYRKHVGLPLSVNMRADFVDEETAGLLREIGVRIVRLGVESGNEHMSRAVLKRHQGVEDLRRGYRLLRDAGIERWSYNIVGLPTETLPMALETVKLNAEIDPELALAFIFYPYPGTALHRLCVEKGLLAGREFDTYKVGVAIRQPGFPDGDVLFVHRYFASLLRAYRAAHRLPAPLTGPAIAAMDAALTSPLLPRGAIVRASEQVRELRHAVGERLVHRWPRLYRALGGRAPMRRVEEAPREDYARVSA